MLQQGRVWVEENIARCHRRHMKRKWLRSDRDMHEWQRHRRHAAHEIVRGFWCSFEDWTGQRGGL